MTTALTRPTPRPLSALVLATLPTKAEWMEHPVTMYLASLAPSGRRAMQDALARVAHIIDPALAEATKEVAIYRIAWHLLRYADMQRIRLSLVETLKLAPGRPATKKGRRVRPFVPGRLSHATVNQALSAVAGVVRECKRLKWMTAEDLEDVREALTRMKENSPKAGRMLEMDEIEKLIASCDLRRPIGARDAAIFAVGLGCGLRRAEIAALGTAHYKESAKAGEAGTVIVEKGKGSKPREVPFPSNMTQAMTAWLGFRGTATGPLICPVSRSGKIYYRHLSTSGIYLAVQKHWRQVELTEKVTPHDFRRTLISRLLDTGVDLVTVQGIAGHANPKTTAGYDRRGERVAREAIEKLGYGWGTTPAAGLRERVSK